MPEPTEKKMQRAIAERDEAFDGQFVYAVSSTGIYCRPSCPSRRPNLKNISFYVNGMAARAAGFRSCIRCQPDAPLNRRQTIIQNACAFIENHLDERISLNHVAKHVGVSQFHLQRTFASALGMSPREYASACRLKNLKAQLQTGSSVTAALYSAGFSGSSRLYESSSNRLGMSPGSYARKGRGTKITYAFFDSVFGWVLIARTEIGICFLQLGAEPAQLLAELHKEFSAAALIEDTEALNLLTQSIQDYLNGITANLRVPLDSGGTAFQKQVWHYLLAIPCGQTRSYGEIAKALERPQSARAVARACATNRISLAIPCHRVVRGDGDLSGYRWGLALKERLLKHEQSFQGISGQRRPDK